MTDGKKKPEDDSPKAQAEDAKSSEDLSDDDLSNAAGGVPAQPVIAACNHSYGYAPTD